MIQKCLFAADAKRYLLCAAFLMALLSAGCSQKEEPDNTPGTEPGQVTMPSDPEQSLSDIAFTASDEWYLEVSEATASKGGEVSWLTVHPTEGMPGDVTLNIVAQPNTTGAVRTATLTLHDGENVTEYSISQSVASSVTTEKQLYSVMPDETALEISVSANTGFRTQVSPYDGETCSWLTLTSDAGASVLKFSMTVNDSLYARSALVEFMSEAGDRRLGYCIVKQAGARKVEGHETLEIPDPAFKEYLIANHDTNKDGSISRIEMGEILYMDCSNSGIKSMDGIEYCDNLIHLNCSGNGITGLNLMECTELQTLRAENCSITFLHLGYNTELTEIRIDYNPLQTLLLGKKPELERLVVSHTKLTSLDVSGMSSLVWLSATDCQIATVNLSGCRSLASAYLNNNRLRHVDLRSLPSLEEYEANFVGNDQMESIHADVAPSFSPNEELVVMWYTETGRHCMYKPYVYVRGELISQQFDLGF